MRTTLNIDDELLDRARERFPPGTPKTVIFEEALRLLVATAAPEPGAAPRLADPRLARLAATGKLAPAKAQAPPAPPGDGLPLARLLSDLAADRADR
jgi:hypothetical protein